MNHFREREERMMGREVGFVAAKFGRILGCRTCGIGAAVDVVGKRWGRGGVSQLCPNHEPNLDDVRIKQVERELERWAITQGHEEAI